MTVNLQFLHRTFLYFLLPLVTACVVHKINTSKTTAIDRLHAKQETTISCGPNTFTLNKNFLCPVIGSPKPGSSHEPGNGCPHQSTISSLLSVNDSDRKKKHDCQA
jgi:hypothetical protein